MCKSDVSRREVKPDAMMTEMIELYKKLVVKVVKEEEEDKEDDERGGGHPRKRRERSDEDDDENEVFGSTRGGEAAKSFAFTQHEGEKERGGRGGREDEDKEYVFVYAFNVGKETVVIASVRVGKRTVARVFA